MSNVDMTDKKPDFAIVLVNYKTLELTKISLSLLKQHMDAALIPATTQIWVVDNNSQDLSTDYLRSLNWINLIERNVTAKEEGFAAHGHALDLVLSKIDCQYLFLMHTDTFIYQPKIFEKLLSELMNKPNAVAIGCLEQLDRGYLRSYWRLVSRFCKHYSRRAVRFFGINGREPKPYKEQYIKSFFALWDVRWMKENNLTFFMQNRIPGYALQDIALKTGRKILHISAMQLFSYLDHVEAGTVGLVAGYDDMNRRVKRKLALLKKYQ